MASDVPKMPQSWKEITSQTFTGSFWTHFFFSMLLGLSFFVFVFFLLFALCLYSFSHLSFSFIFPNSIYFLYSLIGFFYFTFSLLLIFFKISFHISLAPYSFKLY